MSKSESVRVCIVIPSYNEEKALGKVIDGLKKTLKKHPYDVTILCVDDSSRDATGGVALKHGATVIRHILNSGAGGATSTGLRYAKLQNFDIAATMDADGQHDANDVVRGISHLIKTNSDLLIGSRLINNEGMSRVKILGNKGLSFVTFLLFGVNSTDSQSGLRIFSSEALDKLRWETSGYEFCSEMLWRAKQLNLTINEYPIKAIYTDYSKAKGQNNWNAINIVRSLVRRRFLEFFE